MSATPMAGFDLGDEDATADYAPTLEERAWQALLAMLEGGFLNGLDCHRTSEEKALRVGLTVEVAWDLAERHETLAQEHESLAASKEA